MAHATVTVDGCDQFRFVGPFRAIAIPAVNITEISSSQREGAIAAEFEGFREVRGGIVHRRRLSWSQDAISIEDEIHGNARHTIKSVLPLAPGIELQEGQPARVLGVAIEPVGLADRAVEKRWVSERFFDRLPAQAIVTEAEVRLPATVGWQLSLAEGSDAE
jgi:hypothetical protein